MNVVVDDNPKVDVASLISQTKYASLPNAYETLKDCIDRSANAWMGYVDHEPVCLWGLIPPTILSEQAYLWLLTTHKLEAHQFLFVRHSQVMIQKMLAIYPTIVGDTSRDNASAIRWIKWLGGKFGEPQGKMLPFMIRAR